MEARPPAENRHGGAPRGERPASWDAPRLAQRGSVAPRTRDNRHSAPVGAPPTPRWGMDAKGKARTRAHKCTAGTNNTALFDIVRTRTCAHLPGRIVSRASAARPGTHMWTAPGLQELWQRADRIACDHMSGLLMRSHVTAGQDGFRDGSSKQSGGFWSAAGSHGVSHVLDRSITPSARLEQAPASARDENRSHAEFVMPGLWRSPPSPGARSGCGCRADALDCSVPR